MRRALIAGFLKSAERFPSRPALYVESEYYTYEALSVVAGDLAATILDADHGQNPLVALLASRSLTAYAGVLSIHIAGKGYVPLNPKFPVERLARMFSQSQCNMMIVGKEGFQTLERLLPHIDRRITVICPDHDSVPVVADRYSNIRFVTQSKILKGPRYLTSPVVASDSVAYLLFTSGSTGIPKGVPVSQRNVQAYIAYTCNRYQVKEHDRVSQMFDTTFDLSVHDMFVSWERGACLYSVPERFLLAPAKFIKDHQLTLWFSVPSVVGFVSRMGMLKPGSFPSLRVSLFCGEPLHSSYARAWQDAAPNSIVENLYGPTEATIAITAYRWSATSSPQECFNSIVPIGRPFDGQLVSIIDSDQRCVPTGASGELCLSGSQVTQGYWNNPARTSEQFIRLPESSDALWYRTGDLVKQDEAGCLHYLGRLDQQVKIRGYRVELQEIESVLRNASGAQEVAALAWPIREGVAEGIVAFICGESHRDGGAILARCREALPEYMVPKHVHFLDQAPLNVNGKLDRLALVAFLRNQGV